MIDVSMKSSEHTLTASADVVSCVPATLNFR